MHFQFMQVRAVWYIMIIEILLVVNRIACVVFLCVNYDSNHMGEVYDAPKVNIWGKKESYIQRTLFADWIDVKLRYYVWYNIPIMLYVYTDKPLMCTICL